jgi:transcription-repair coupling factor (superfamily II helicase)
MEGHLKDEDPLVPIIHLLRDRQAKGENIVLTCHNKVQAERLSDLFRWQGLQLLHFDSSFETLHDTPAAAFRIRLARLSSGFRWPAEKLSIITDEELFGSKVIRKPKARAPLEHFTSFSELIEGDYLVHEQHGIGRYRGLKNLSFEGTNSDFIQLEYLGGDKLYLPVYRLNLLQRYVGPGDAPPFLDRLGGTRWDKAQKKAIHDILTTAKELLRIYASRELYPGYPFPPSDLSYEEFSAAFPYDETPDQERAIDDVSRDMEIERPMDRLICGDVGYGKTEVAMRAAFKAAIAGKQIAVLVPTTLLALQHFESFTKRFEKTPVRVEMLSRFRSAKEQTAIVEELKRGTVDIIIGTHRLLQKDVSFKDLGLLIIDEEQRFGVAHKERIKKLRATVDCLTLTATPIPRTLHLSLSGIRDISVIDTAPMDRLSILTHIVPFDDGVIRHAILTELARGGQLFFVHNRVETIRSMEEYLKRLIPEASIAVAHGQLKEHELEDVMHRFLTRQHNVLLTTSIIESGLDIPSANTILVNRADTFGLAQLYQIRGRVGRSNIRAYAYLLIPADGIISPTAKKRLSVLSRFTELGSGFQIAMHDLEIRGSGNILGRAQSGHVAAIGYEMYTKLLNREIKKLQGKVVEEEIEPEIHLPVSAFFPEAYMTDPGMRLDLYRRLASRETIEEVKDLEREMTDRFGELPPEGKNLIGIMEIKVLAKSLKIHQISFDGRTFACQLDKSTPLDFDKLAKLLEKEPHRYRLRPPDRILSITAGLEEASSIIAEAKNFLSVLQSCASGTANSKH